MQIGVLYLLTKSFSVVICLSHLFYFLLNNQIDVSSVGASTLDESGLTLTFF